MLHASGLSPAVITQCLHRRFLDVNRPEGHDPYQDARLAKHYRIFHDAVDDAVRTAYQRHGRALLIDLHGFATSPGPERYDLVLGSDSGATCPLASDRVLQAMLDARGWNVAFSPDPARGVSARYRGGWTVRRTARDFRLEQVEACQIEIARHLRTGEDFLTADAERLVVDLADTLMALMHRARRGVA
ncbi:N-formylglutamate amidohydrolase [Candidatus Uhrbacteria bacterium]|nr:N-formylglutamate amidohydrolase [Candidatus Uhrbacteria bacterium]